MQDISLTDMRRTDKVKRETLLEEELPTKDPVALFHKWLAEAEDSGQGSTSLLSETNFALGKAFPSNL